MRQPTGTRSIWTNDATTERWPDSPSETTVDVCVIGGGIAGLSVAYRAARDGLHVAVLDSRGPSTGESPRTTAHLACVLDDRFQHIEKMHGVEATQLAWRSHARAIDEIERAIHHEQIDCDFARLDGYLFLGEAESVDFLERERDSAQRAGFPDAALQSGGADVGFAIGPCLKFSRQAQLHPVKYLAGLARAVREADGQLFGNAHVVEAEGGPSAFVKTSSGAKINAKWIVVATNTPVIDRFIIHTKQAPYRTYVVAARIPKGSLKPALYWDTSDPYHYVRLQPAESSDLLIIGGEDHKTGQEPNTDERLARLERWGRIRFPFMGEVVAGWSGQVFEPVDGLAFIGRNPMDHGNVFIATGDSGMGMTHGTIAGILISDLIMGRENPWAALYDPARRTLGSLWEYTKENVNVAAQYLDWLSGSDVDSPDAVKPGCGAVVRRGLSKVALYRDSNGALHECSAICPHLGGIVTWNATEQTWDCPCHGSRFTPTGEVLCGPTLSGLKPAGVAR